MRVLHLTTEFPPVIWGGLGTAVGGLVTASARERISVGVRLVGGVLVAEGSYGAWQAGSFGAFPSGLGRVTVTPEGITFFHVAPDEAVEAGLRLAQSWRPDVIHLHSTWLWHVARAMRDAHHLPIVFTVHSLDRAEYEQGGFVTHWQAQEEVIGTADRVIAISRSECDLLVCYCPDATPRVRIVGNGIDDTFLARRAAVRRRGDRAPLVVYSGRFVERKGIRELLEAMPRALAASPEVRFVLVGGSGGAVQVERDWLTNELRSYGDRIRFTGWLPPAEVARWYAVADVMVVPSWYEPFGMVILEGMLHGLAIAAAAVGGPAEILEHDRTGILFPPRDVDGLATAMLRLVRDRELRRRIGQAAAVEVRQAWLWPRLVRRMGTIYREVMAA
jgi:glycogen synthase